MQAKTIFLTLEDEIIYNNMFHDNNHNDYIKKYYSDLKINEYIPILLTRYEHCVIDLSKPYLLGVVYLPVWMSTFQKDYFINNKSVLENYTLYLNGYSLEKPILIDELLNIIDLMPSKPKEKKLIF